MKVVTAAQMSAIEQASDRAGVSLDTLMENAGLAVARALRDQLGGAAGLRAVILVGPGNNGADGLVVARHLRRWGADVVCCLLTRRPEYDPKLDLARHYDVGIIPEPDSVALDRLLRRSHVVVDAVLGTGRSRPLDGPVREAMLALQRLRPSTGRPGPVEAPPRSTHSGSPSHSRAGGNPSTAPAPAEEAPLLVALDLPTGLNPDTGDGDPACASFDLTLALGYPKLGLLIFPGAQQVGRLRVLDIGIPPGLPEEQSVDVEMLTPAVVASRLPTRRLDSHKGTHGHALIVAGSRNYVGAAWLASQASVRTGAGLTTLASPESVYPIAAAKGAEAIHLPLPEDADGRIRPSAADILLQAVRPQPSVQPDPLPGPGPVERRTAPRRFSAMLVGCGMGLSDGATEFLRLLLHGAHDRLAGLPLVVDADGLNNLSRIEDWPARVSRPLVLTPHPGEMSTLTGLSVSEIQSGRLAVAREWAARWNATLVLKGAHSVIASPGQPVRIAPFANPGLATGGTGDVLSGVIVSLLAQGLPPADAAACGVWLHASAARSVTDRIGHAGLAASDLLEALPLAIASLFRP